MKKRIKRWAAMWMALMLLAHLAPASAHAQGPGTTVYFANSIEDTNVRYSAVSVRKQGQSAWQYSNYFAPMWANETSSAFSLDDGEYEYVMSVSFKRTITEIEGTFSVQGGVVQNLTSNANAGASLQTQNGEWLIVAGGDVNVSASSANSIFFKVKQPEGLTAQQMAQGVGFYTQRGVKLGVYNYNAGGTLSVLLPKTIQNGAQAVAQTSYSYEVAISGYAPARGTVSGLSGSNNTTRYTWQENQDAKAEKIENSSTSGYQVYLAPAVQGTKTVNFAVICGGQPADIAVQSPAGEPLVPSGEGQYAVALPQQGKETYSYTVESEHFAAVNGSFEVDASGAVTDTTPAAQVQRAVSYGFANDTFQIQLSPQTRLSELAPDAGGTYSVEVPMSSFQDGWTPGESKTGSFFMENDTADRYLVSGYEVVIRDAAGDYSMRNVLRSANPAVCALYGWSGRENSTLAGLVNLEEKIKQTFENDAAYCADYAFTYSDYLLYYYKTKYPQQYASATSLQQLSAEHQYEIFSQCNSTDDCWYDDGVGDEFGNIDIDAALAQGRLYSYRAGAKYGALELDHEVAQLAKAIAFRDGFLYTFDTAKTQLSAAPSLYDWAEKTQKAEQAFHLFADGLALAPNESLHLQRMGFQLSGGAFSNCFQVVEWDYTIRLLLQKDGGGAPNSYTAAYEFESGTDGKALPAEIRALLPTDGRSYTEGQVIKALAPANTQVQTADGVWTFMGYGYTAKEANAANADANGVVWFTGVWAYKANGGPATAGTQAKPNPKTGRALL